MKSILLIGSSNELAQQVSLTLSRAGYQVHLEKEMSRGLSKLYTLLPDMVIFDSSAALQGGREFCSGLRNVCDIPALALVKNEDDNVLLLNSGADACITSDTSERLLVAWVASLFRRRYITGYKFPYGIRLDAVNCCLVCGESLIELTHTEFALAACLLMNTGKTVSYADLVFNLWGGPPPRRSSLDFHAFSLRKKLEDDPYCNLKLEACRGVGLRLVVDTGNFGEYA